MECRERPMTGELDSDTSVDGSLVGVTASFSASSSQESATGFDLGMAFGLDVAVETLRFERLDWSSFAIEAMSCAAGNWAPTTKELDYSGDERSERNDQREMELLLMYYE